MTLRPSQLHEVFAEVEAIDLGDHRLEVRAQEMIVALALRPDRGVTSAMVEPREAEAAYRFLRNPRVDAEAVVEPHFDKSVARIREAGTALIIHDTSEFKYSGSTHRDGLGPLHGSGQGFLGHFSLAVSNDEWVRPLGVVAMTTWARAPQRKGKRAVKRSGWAYSKQSEKESGRWQEHIDDVAQRVGSDVPIIHVADREADAFPLLLHLVDNGHRFVVRMARDRRGRIDEWAELETVRSIVSDTGDVMVTEVGINKRKGAALPRMGKVRDARTAKLGFASKRLQIKRPYYLFNETMWLDLNVVHVREIDAPRGAEPIDWVLLTSEPIDTPDQVRRIVECYRRRWLIEEYFKALKTGCAMEKRELESFDSLGRALALFVPIAFHMLLLRSVARAAKETTAAAILTTTQIEVLVAMGRVRQNPTARDALMAVAQMGGYYNKQRPPGWLVLARGVQDLIRYEHGWMAAKAHFSEQEAIKR